MTLDIFFFRFKNQFQHKIVRDIVYINISINILNPLITHAATMIYFRSQATALA